MCQFDPRWSESRMQTNCDALRNIILFCMLTFATSAIAVRADGPVSKEELRKDAAVYLELSIENIKEVKDPDLVSGSYLCANGKVTSVKMIARNLKAEDLKRLHKRGDQVSISLDCLPAETALGPGQLPTDPCSKVKAAKRVRAWSRDPGFPRAVPKGCASPDLGYEY